MLHIKNFKRILKLLTNNSFLNIELICLNNDLKNSLVINLFYSNLSSQLPMISSVILLKNYITLLAGIN